MIFGIPEIVTVNLLVTAIVFAIIVSIVTSIIVAAIKIIAGNSVSSNLAGWYYLVLYSIPISIVAYIAGYLTAFSRSAAVGTVIPAVLALIGGLNIYIFGTEAKNKDIVAYCICVFAITLFYGAQVGAYRRDADRAIRLIDLTRQEKIIRNIRGSLGLPEDMPPWIIGTEPR